MTNFRSSPTTAIRCTATSAALIGALADLIDSPNFRPGFFSLYDAATLERLARQIRRGIEGEAEKAVRNGRDGR